MGRIQLLPAKVVQGGPAMAFFDLCVGTREPAWTPVIGMRGKVHGPYGWLFEAFANGLVGLPPLHSTP